MALTLSLVPEAMAEFPHAEMDGGSFSFKDGPHFTECYVYLIAEDGTKMMPDKKEVEHNLHKVMNNKNTKVGGRQKRSMTSGYVL